MAKPNTLLIFILTIGVFGILNTEMGVIGILPAIADHFHVSISKAGLLVSLFSLVVAISGPSMPLLFSGIERKRVMLLTLGVFLMGNIVSIFTSSFTVLLAARIIPAFFHPIYCSLAFTAAADSVSKEKAPKAVSNVFIGVSAGMVVGVPIVSLLNNTVSFDMAMAFFAIVNALVFIATLLIVPVMPIKEVLTYGEQLSVLKKVNTWLSIAAVVFLNSAIFGVYSYFAEYLQTVTKMSSNIISFMLFVYGAANIIGNILAGKLLTKSAIVSVTAFPFVLGAIYIILFFTGQFTMPMAIITLIWGILAGLGSNINQYWITSAAPEAPDFANGLFLSSCNIGTTIGAAAAVVLAGLLSLVLAAVFVLLRNYVNNTSQRLSS
ncbi:Predicted arabinose efflux permease, MFS family [Bacillus sp. OV322]|uniref:MFS transporter n=1 Tax=Bacillus sp. OV322 TaxID=1882764 RepID=UPI0008E1533B|nr:MFS transporter [Bacillus sp. OV322]SFC67848.1 Predicted arabinose efflux permease, MFS family [Bacillus sp. OV322]